MKKHYLRFGVFYCLLALALFLAAISVYTKKKVDKVNEFGGRSVINNYTMLMGDEYESERGLVRTLLNNWKYIGENRNEDTAFYSAIIDVKNNYSVVFETQDFIEVEYYGEFEEKSDGSWTQISYGTNKFILLDEPLSITPDQASDMRSTSRSSVTGAECDDLFLYGGELSFPSEGQTITLPIGTPELADTASGVPYEEYLPRVDEANPCILVGTSAKSKLYDRAHELCDTYLEQYLDGQATSALTIDKGIFTTTASAIRVVNDGDLIVVFYSIDKPFNVVFKENTKVYIGSLIALIFVEILIISSVRKLYLDQKEFETASRRMAGYLAEDLKKPLSKTKSYIERWEAQGDNKKADYSDKIITEVDNMSDMVTKVLASSKKDSRKNKK